MTCFLILERIWIVNLLRCFNEMVCFLSGAKCGFVIVTIAKLSSEIVLGIGIDVYKIYSFYWWNFMFNSRHMCVFRYLEGSRVRGEKLE